MLEKLVTFLVLGTIVFAPGVHHWLASADPVGWYLVYIPWLALIIAVSREQWQRSRSR